MAMVMGEWYYLHYIIIFFRVVPYFQIFSEKSKWFNTEHDQFRGSVGTTTLSRRQIHYSTGHVRHVQSMESYRVHGGKHGVPENSPLASWEPTQSQALFGPKTLKTALNNTTLQKACVRCIPVLAYSIHLWHTVVLWHANIGWERIAWHRSKPLAAGQRGWHQKFQQFVNFPLSKGFLASSDVPIAKQWGMLQVEKKPTDTADCHAAVKSWCDHTQKHRGQRSRCIWPGQSVDSSEVNQKCFTVSTSLHFLICHPWSRNSEGAKTVPSAVRCKQYATHCISKDLGTPYGNEK